MDRKLPGALPSGLAALLFALCLASGALAQSVRPVAPSIPPPQGTPIPQIAPRPGPDVGPAPPLQGPPPSAAPAPAATLKVSAVAIDGVTAFAADTLRPMVSGLVGPSVPLARVESARVALLGLYRENGYVFTTVDAVLHADGTLHFVVGESQVTEVLLDGDIGPAGRLVIRFLDHLRQVRPLDIASLERWLLLAKDIPGVSIQPVLRPAGTAPGALTLVARVSRQAISGFFTADNRADSLAGPEQALAALQFNSFTALGERTELSLYGAARASQLFGQASTEFYAGASGLRIRLYAGHGYARPDGVLRSIGYQGETTIAGAAAFYPLVRRRAYSLTLDGSFDAIESDTDIDAFGGTTTQLSHDAFRVVRLGGVGAIYDQLLGDSRPGANQLTVRLSQGLDAFGASTNARTGATVSFTKIVFDATRVQTLFVPWSGGTVALQGSLAGQWSDDVLPLPEKFYLGGARLGRGYFAGEVTGDRALAASVELQLITSFATDLFGRAVHVQPTFYGFYDWGETWENQPADANRRLASFGVGLRVPVDDRYEVQLEGVHRETRQPGGAGSQKLRANAIFWRVVLRL
jgi:hemolysin activation/secretion protein